MSIRCCLYRKCFWQVDEVNHSGDLSLASQLSLCLSLHILYVYVPLILRNWMVPTGKEVVQKTDVPVSLDVMEEAKVAGRVKRAATSAIAAAAVKAKLLADQEEREMQRLIAAVIDQQVIQKASSAQEDRSWINSVLAKCLE